MLKTKRVLPAPDRYVSKGVDTPWRTFIAAHAESLLAIDFFCMNIWTALGKRIALWGLKRTRHRGRWTRRWV